MIHLTVEDFEDAANNFVKFYQLNGFESEEKLWYNTEKEKNQSYQEPEELPVRLKKQALLSQNIRKAPLITFSKFMMSSQPVAKLI